MKRQRHRKGDQTECDRALARVAGLVSEMSPVLPTDTRVTTEAASQSQNRSPLSSWCLECAVSH